MKTNILLIIFLIITTSCNYNKNKKPQKQELVMYKPSEMTVLMREMFEFQEKSKKQIEKGELPLNFPEKFKKIHSAKMSSDFEHDASFQNFSSLFLENINDLNNSTTKNAKANFNTAIKTCIACHNTTCHGPIVRIKKLVIN